jgi:hypothetical protein
VSNFLSAEDVETTIAVTKAADPLPEVTVEGPLQGIALAGNSFYITATGKVKFLPLYFQRLVLYFTWVK